jgi:hypothetical protein
MATPEIKYMRQGSKRGFTLDTIGFAIVETGPKVKQPLLRIYGQSPEDYLFLDWLSYK